MKMSRELKYNTRKYILVLILIILLIVSSILIYKTDNFKLIFNKRKINNSITEMISDAKKQTANIEEHIYNNKAQNIENRYNILQDQQKITVLNNDILVEYNINSIQNDFSKIKLKNQELNKEKTKENKLLNAIKEYYIQTQVNSKVIQEQVEEKEKNIKKIISEQEKIQKEKKETESKEKIIEKENQKIQEEKDKNILKEKEKKIDEEKNKYSKEIYLEIKKIFANIIGKEIDKYEGINIEEKGESIIIKLGKKYNISGNLEYINKYENIVIYVDKITGVILEVNKENIPYEEKNTKINVYQAKDELEKRIRKIKKEDNQEISYNKKEFRIDLVLGYDNEKKEVVKAYKVTGIYTITKPKQESEEVEQTTKEINVIVSTNDGKVLEEV
ncbi:MAG: hypothetical protein ACTTGJ_04305 [Clostridium sp.]